MNTTIICTTGAAGGILWCGILHESVSASDLKAECKSMTPYSPTVKQTLAEDFFVTDIN